MATTLTILGGGNMGGAIARALAAKSTHELRLVEPDADKRAQFSTLGITCFATLAESPPSDVLLVAIKPQQWDQTAKEIASYKGNRELLLISIMAGISIAALQQITPRVVRVMPNLPATIGEGMSVLTAPASVSASDREVSAQLFETVGEIAWVNDEAELHAVTAVSGSGPGFVYAFMEALEQAAINQGLNAALAKTLITQTLCGASLLARESASTYAELRTQVTSKGGTTEAGLQALLTPAFQEAIEGAVLAAAARSKSLSGE